MIRREWNELLFWAYKEGRDQMGWADLYELHDEEDQKYFMDLDVFYGR